MISTLDNPLLNGLALGLTFHEDGGVSPQSGLYPCCQAAGGAWDENLYAYRSCKLGTRLKRVQGLVQQFRRQWPKATRSPQQVSPQVGGQILQELAAVFRHDQAPATLTMQTTRAQASGSASPSVLWSKALASVWRFGVETRVINLQNVDPKNLAAFTAESGGQAAWFVEQVEKLWDPATAETFEYIVQRAYNAEAFLWVDLRLDGDCRQLNDAAADFSVKASISRKIAKLRQQHPLDCISRDCLSRLQSLSGGSLLLQKGDAQNA